MTFPGSVRRILATVAALTLLLTACGGSGTTTTTSSPETTTTTEAPTTTTTEPAEDTGFPRTITHANGETVIEEQPVRVVSTSITITGTLLAIGAPVVATAATTPGPLTDDNGFFAQWADVATERDVEVLYPNLEFDLEAVIAADPDVIIVSTSGADSALEHYDALAAVAPTLVYNYGKQSWESLALEISEALGLEEEAQATIDDFDAYVAETAAALTLPDPNTASGVVFNGAQNDSAVAKVGNAQASIFEALGFEVIGAPDELDTSETARQDFAFVSLENLGLAIAGETVFLINGTDQTAADFVETPVLANLAAVKNGAVIPLGPTSFRIDYYSARSVVDTIRTVFG